MLKKRISAALCVVFIIALAAYSRTNGAFDDPAVFAGAREAAAPPLGDDLPVSRALTAKMLALAFADINEINNMPSVISFTDTPPDKWYYKFINAAVSLKILSGYGDEFRPEKPLSLAEAQSILEKIGSRADFLVDGGNGDKAVSYALWLEAYKNFLKEKGDANILEKRLVVLAGKAQNPELPSFFAVTDKGGVMFSGFVTDPYIDREISVLMKNDEVAAVCAVTSDEPSLKNCYITKCSGGSVTLFSGGAFRQYKTRLALTPGSVSDVKIKNGEAVSADAYAEPFRDEIISFNGEFSFKNHGVYKTSENFAVYAEKDGSASIAPRQALLVGTDVARFYERNGEVFAAVVDKAPELGNIRVLISGSGGAYLHDSVKIQGDGDFLVESGEGKAAYSQTYKKGEIFSPLGGDAFFRLSPADGVRFKLLSAGKAEEIAYRGKIEVSRRGGKFVLVNELPMEDYLRGVLPSEMPAGYGAEALKAQAVAARSFAYSQYYANRYHEYGANVDDTTQCQVYNNAPETAQTDAAVAATRGLCLFRQGGVIPAYFFSTSAGYTAASGEVWADGAVFPASGGTTASKQYAGGDFGDLSAEENARKFFKDWDVNSFERDFPWFRWRAAMSAAEVTRSVNASIAARSAVNPALIKTLASDGSYRSLPADSVGDVLNLEVLRRGQGGNIMELKITGTKRTVIVYTEYNVRALLRPGQIERRDGSFVENFALMPSAFFAVDKTADGFAFYGGGYGHGAGLSQNGAKALADKGLNALDILKQYYDGAEIKELRYSAFTFHKP
ncbi:MAG: SpoIID/LytB domain-containing protein [Clostridiales bacterium]|nr:SpoIID/LytB domain-containing protein [Clostridiales bacterium]